MSRKVEGEEGTEQTADSSTSANGTSAGASATDSVPVPSTSIPGAANKSDSFSGHKLVFENNRHGNSDLQRQQKTNHHPDPADMVNVGTLAEEGASLETTERLLSSITLEDSAASGLHLNTGIPANNNNSQQSPPKKRPSTSSNTSIDLLHDSDDDSDDSSKKTQGSGYLPQKQNETKTTKGNHNHSNPRGQVSHDDSIGNLSHGSMSSVKRSSNTGERRRQMARSISNPRLQLSPKRSSSRATLAGNASFSSLSLHGLVVKKACAPQRPKHLQPSRKKSEKALRVELSHTTGTGMATSTTKDQDTTTTSHHVSTRPTPNTSNSSKGLLAAVMDANLRDSSQSGLLNKFMDDRSVSSSSTSNASFHSRHTFRPSESIDVDKVGSLSNLDISIAEQNGWLLQDDNVTDATFSSQSTTSLRPRRFPPGFTANHHRVTCAKRNAIPEEGEDEQTSNRSSGGMFSTFSNNVGFLGSFVEQRRKTFTSNITTIAEILTNQREIVSGDDDDGSSSEFREQEKCHRKSRDEHDMATYLWGGVS